MSPSTTTPSDPAAAASSSSPAASCSPALTPTMADDELEQAQDTCGGDADRVPGLRQPDRGDLQPRGRRRPAALARHRWRRSSTARSPSGTTRPSRPTTPTPTCPSTDITPVHRSDESGTRRTSPTTSSQIAAGRLVLRASTTSGRSRAGRPPTAPRASCRRVKGGDGTIGYADASQAGDLGKAKIKVGERVRRAQRRGGGRGPRRVAPAARCQRRPTSRSTSTARPPRPASTRSCWCRTTIVCSRLRHAGPGRPGQGLRVLRDQRGRAETPQPMRPDPLRSRTRSASRPQTRDRHDRNHQLVRPARRAARASGCRTPAGSSV